jgi:hypothetical protein
LNVNDIFASLPPHVTMVRLTRPIADMTTRFSASDTYSMLNSWPAGDISLSHKARQSITHFDVHTVFGFDADTDNPHAGDWLAHWFATTLPNLCILMIGGPSTDVAHFKHALFTRCSSVRILVVPKLIYTDDDESMMTSVLFKIRRGIAYVATRRTPPPLPPSGFRVFTHRKPTWSPVSTLSPSHPVHDIIPMIADYEMNEFSEKFTVFFRP